MQRLRHERVVAAAFRIRNVSDRTLDHWPLVAERLASRRAKFAGHQRLHQRLEQRNHGGFSRSEAWLRVRVM